MKSSPFHDEGQGPWRKRAGEQANRLDANLRLNPAIARVKVRRLVIQEIHADYDPEESGDLRHTEFERVLWSGLTALLQAQRAALEPSSRAEICPALRRLQPLLGRCGTGRQAGGESLATIARCLKAERCIQGLSWSVFGAHDHVHRQDLSSGALL